MPQINVVEMDTRELFCFRDRSRQIYRRVIASRPLYVCTGPCGQTREIHELGGAQPDAPTRSIGARPTAPVATDNESRGIPRSAPRPAKVSAAALRLAAPVLTPEACADRLARRRESLEKLKAKKIKEKAPMAEKNPLQKLIDAAVAAAVEPLEARIKELEDGAGEKSESAIDPEKFQIMFDELIEKQLEGTAPARKSAATKSGGKRKPATCGKCSGEGHNARSCKA